MSAAEVPQPEPVLIGIVRSYTAAGFTTYRVWRLADLAELGTVVNTVTGWDAFDRTGAPARTSMRTREEGFEALQPQAVVSRY